MTEAAFPAVIDLANLTANQGCEVLGATVGDRRGISVSGMGDVNGDGLVDVLVAAHQAQNLTGVDYLLFGRNGSPCYTRFSQL